MSRMSSWVRGLTRLRTRRLSLPAALLISVVALAAGGGVALAAKQIISPDPATGVIHACYNSASGEIRLVNTGETCGHGDTAIQWNQTGPGGVAGPPGPPGPAGTARDAGAVVSVGQGGPSFYPQGLRGWVSVTSPHTGYYCLTPDAGSTVGNTVLVLSAGSPGAGAGIIEWSGYCSLTPFVLAVSTVDLSGIPVSNEPFVAIIP